MIGATASALQGQPVWLYLAWGFPAALLVATFWAHFTLRRTIAEIQLRSGQAAVRSVQDVLSGQSSTWHPLFKVRTTPWHTEVSVGWNTYELAPRDWPEYEELRDAAREAFNPNTSNSIRPPSYA